MIFVYSFMSVWHLPWDQSMVGTSIANFFSDIFVNKFQVTGGTSAVETLTLAKYSVEFSGWLSV